MTKEVKVVKEQSVLGKTFKVYGDYDNPFFMAKDVAEWIGHSNVTEMISRVDSEELTKLNLGSRQGETWFLTEDGLYEVLFQSRKAVAKAFKKEVKRLLKSMRLGRVNRLAGIEARKTLTDTIQESGINEKMHGFAYSNFTKMIYKKAGIEYVKSENFRNSLNAEQLKAIEQYEKLADSYLQLGYDYSQIKELLPDTIKLLESKEV